MKYWCYIACLLCGHLALAQDPIQIIGRNTGEKILADGNAVRTFGFAREFDENPPVPGPTIEVTEGDSVVIDFWNISQGAPHTIHLHGLDVNQQNDGVPHLSFEVHHMEHGFYRFRAPHAGTYLYHCHVVSSIHVQAGMFGLLVVHPPSGEGYTWEGGYEIHSETRMFMSEIDTNWHADSVLLHDYDTSHAHQTIPIPVYDPQHFLVNGRSEQQLVEQVVIRGQVHGNIYLRLANIGYLGNRVIFPAGLNARVIDSDGRPLPSEEVTDTVELYPGERYGVLCNPSTEFDGTAIVQYLNMNTGAVKNEQAIAVEVSGFWSVEEPEGQELKLFPNPAGQALTVVLPDGAQGQQTRLHITTANGTAVKMQAFTGQIGNTVHIPVADLPPGVYLLTLTTGDAQYRQRFVKP